ncbi:hypothetical protein K501DRAFT_272488 [Backusella circina FSU 941]|nr:hypothetical protein K501DRAFT_272488 [Backusella circina FSU 941]
MNRRTHVLQAILQLNYAIISIIRACELGIRNLYEVLIFFFSCNKNNQFKIQNGFQQQQENSARCAAAAAAASTHIPIFVNQRKPISANFAENGNGVVEPKSTGSVEKTSVDDNAIDMGVVVSRVLGIVEPSAESFSLSPLSSSCSDEDVSVADSNSDIKKNLQTNINKFHNEIYKSTQAVILAKNHNDADKHSIHLSFLKKLKQVQETYEMLFKDRIYNLK